MTEPVASVVIVNKDGKEDLKQCLTSVLSQDIDEYEVIVVDNDSSDGSVKLVKENFPKVKLVENDRNRWYAGGNNDGFYRATGRHLVVLNPDTEVDSDWLRRLIAPLRRDDANVGLTTSKIVQYDDRDVLNTCGNFAHYTGLGFTRGKNKKRNEWNREEVVPAVSGCCFAISGEVYDEIEGFHPELEFYYEDLDLSWRAKLRGYDIVCVPDSIVYHKYEHWMPPWKFHNMERNRYWILLKHLKAKTLIALLPALLITETLMLAYAISKGPSWVRSKYEAWKTLLNDRRRLATRRQEVQAMRNRTDAQLLKTSTVGFPASQFDLPLSAVVSKLAYCCYYPPYWVAQQL